MTLIQRFGSAANLNIHLHCLILDGVYRLTDGVPVFQPVPAPTTEQLQALLTRMITRLLKVLTRHGALSEEDTGIPYLADSDHDPALAPLHAAACTYRIALGPRAGQKVLTWKEPSLRLASPEGPQPQGCVSAQGFSLHADTCCAPHQRHTLERLCRYITRPALSHKRLRRTPAGEVVLQLKTPYRDGTTHLVMSPLEFLQRLAALVPHPRLHLIRFHGVLAPNAALRSQIVPGEADQAMVPTADAGDPPSVSTRARLSWAQLLKRVFAIDMAACPQCGGPLTLIAAIEDPAVIVKILAHLGLPTRTPPAGTRPPRRVLADGLIPTGSNGLIPPWLLVQLPNQHSPFAHFPTPPAKMERHASSYPRHKSHSGPARRLKPSHREPLIGRLTPRRLLWYFSVYSKRPFQIPTPFPFRGIAFRLIPIGERTYYFRAALTRLLSLECKPSVAAGRSGGANLENLI